MIMQVRGKRIAHKHPYAIEVWFAQVVSQFWHCALTVNGYLPSGIPSNGQRDLSFAWVVGSGRRPCIDDHRAAGCVSYGSLRTRRRWTVHSRHLADHLESVLPVRTTVR